MGWTVIAIITVISVTITAITLVLIFWSLIILLGLFIGLIGLVEIEIIIGRKGLETCPFFQFL